MRPFVMSKKMKEKYQRWQEYGLQAEAPQSWDDWESLCRRGGALIRRLLEECPKGQESSVRRRDVKKQRRPRGRTRTCGRGAGEQITSNMQNNIQENKNETR